MFSDFLKNPYQKIITLLVKESTNSKEDKEINMILSKIDLVLLFDICKKNEVASIAFPRLCKFVNPDLIENFRVEYIITKKQNEWMMQNLKEIGSEFEKSDIEIVALKNAGIALGILNDFGISPMGDIDTLIRKEDFLKAHEIIVNLGYKFKFRSEFEDEDIETAFIDGSTEYLLSKDNKEMWLEISWRPVAGRWINPKFEPKANKLIVDSKYIEGTKVKILSPEDNLLQVCAHTAKHSYIRKPGFRLHLDVERIVSHKIIDWDVFIKKTISARTCTAVYFSLLSAKSLFNTKIPDRVINELRPSKLKKKYVISKIEKMDLINYEKTKFSKIEYLLFQSSIYDSIGDLLKVAFPGSKVLKSKYRKENIVKSQFLYLLDLAGIRKKYN